MKLLSDVQPTKGDQLDVISDVFSYPPIAEQDPLSTDTSPVIMSAAQQLSLNITRERFLLPPSEEKVKSSRPVQALLHGCPGSGKSHEAAIWASEMVKSVTVVFHPETTYADFVGVFRPFPVYKVSTEEFFTAAREVFPDGEPYVTYRFVAGPLLEAYCFAKANPEEPVALVVEELSRANASLVFGDMLQLLDRITEGLMKGWSSYEISPKPEVRDFLLRHGIDEVSEGKMRFPPNLYIWATMNRSDQNARQLDSAFLRRWTKKYMSYDQVCAYGSEKVEVPEASTMAWDELRARINTSLLEFAPEDKFIGPYFLPKSSLHNKETVAEDLLGYLWNDVLKARAKEFFTLPTLTEVIRAWVEGTKNPFKDVSLD
jgi:5-methylcytosine-specific restriction endonuclease McrBC GTP-binding regulatory subunit McrB